MSNAPKRPSPDHCMRGHDRRIHGRVYAGGQKVCLKCKELSRKALQGYRANFNTPTALSLLADKWDNEVRRFGLVHSVEETAKHFGIECGTAEFVIYGKFVNYPFSWRQPPSASRSGQNLGHRA